MSKLSKFFTKKTPEEETTIMNDSNNKNNTSAAPDGELIAVFAAAIAQATGNSEFRVVSYRRSGQAAPVWNIRGRNDYLSGKL